MSDTREQIAMDLDRPPSVIIRPSPIKVLGEIILGAVVGTAGLYVFILIFGFIANPWLLSHAFTILECVVAFFACFGAIAVIVSKACHRPRVQINPDGFVCQGISGSRTRRWSDVEGDFVVGRTDLFRPMVSYRLTDEAFKAYAQKRRAASAVKKDEAIIFCAELEISASELAGILNQRKNDASGVHGTPK
jgi:hypothetical protein